MKSKFSQLFFYVVLLLICIISLLYNGSIPQDTHYHEFADSRTIANINNFWNVISNLPFLIIGLYGILKARSLNGLVSFDKISILLLSIGFIGTCFGSSYYHFSPNNSTLVWDRLPMTIIFMSFFSILIYQLLNKKLGRLLLPGLLSLGIFSVWYWNFTENKGQGDLRMYVLVQFYPIVIIPFLIAFNWSEVSKRKHLLYTLIYYGLAKVTETEIMDHSIFESLTFISGHSLKHLFAALAGLHILQWCVPSNNNNEKESTILH